MDQVFLTSFQFQGSKMMNWYWKCQFEDFSNKSSPTFFVLQVLHSWIFNDQESFLNFLGQNTGCLKGRLHACNGIQQNWRVESLKANSIIKCNAACVSSHAPIMFDFFSSKTFVLLMQKILWHFSQNFPKVGRRARNSSQYFSLTKGFGAVAAPCAFPPLFFAVETIVRSRKIHT